MPDDKEDLPQTIEQEIKPGEMPKPYLKHLGDVEREAIQAFSSNGEVRTFYYSGVSIKADLTTEEGRNYVAEQIARLNLYFNCNAAIGPDLSRWGDPDKDELIVDKDPKQLGIYTDTELPYIVYQEQRLNIPNSRILKAHDTNGSFAKEVDNVKAVLPVISSQ